MRATSGQLDPADPLTPLLTRHSLGGKHLGEPGPDDAALARIEAWPSIGPSVERSVRCVPLRRLPWRVYYELDDTGFEVIAVLHAKRGTEAISDALDRDE